MRETGYGSSALEHACRVAPEWSKLPGSGPRASLTRLRAGGAYLAWYRFNLPVADVRLTASPSAGPIADHLAIRDGRRWRYRRAQAALPLPGEFAEYMRGRSRQAVRTNVARAREAGFTVLSIPDESWVPGTDDFRLKHIAPGPVERWRVLDSDGVGMGEAILSVDEDVALLHGLISLATYARWLLHTAIVERLCGSCSLLLVNTEEIYLLPAGNQHFQRLLGYEIFRLRVTEAPRPTTVELPAQPLTLPLPPERVPSDSTI